MRQTRKIRTRPGDRFMHLRLLLDKLALASDAVLARRFSSIVRTSERACALCSSCGPARRIAVSAGKRDWRRVHHSPWFWVGAAMFMAAILTYVFSEDLSLRPQRHAWLEIGPDRIF